jgi:ADP-ribose pyrophosphatase
MEGIFERLRELEEETGFVAGSIARLGEYLSTPGFCGERLHLFLARDLRPGTRRLEQGEESMELLRVPLRRALAWCRDGTIRDGKTVAGLMLAAMETGVAQVRDA